MTKIVCERCGLILDYTVRDKETYYLKPCKCVADKILSLNRDMAKMKKDIDKLEELINYYADGVEGAD